MNSTEVESGSDRRHCFLVKVRMAKPERANEDLVRRRYYREQANYTGNPKALPFFKANAVLTYVGQPDKESPQQLPPLSAPGKLNCKLFQRLPSVDE